jgi:tetratricopeptide (TPR) repeat protein
MHDFRTDISNMTREDIFKSATHFLHAAIITTPLFFCIVFVVGHLSGNEEGIEGLSWVGFVLSIVWLLTAFVLSLRGLLRSKEYIPPNYEQELFSKGLVYMGSNNFVRARSLFAKATKLFPYSPTVWSAYGIVSADLGDYSTAKESYEQAISIYKQNLYDEPLGPKELLHEIGLLVMLRRNKEAEQILSELWNRYPEETQVQLSERGISELTEEMSQYIVPEDQTV